MRTLKGHFDGERIVLDEPFDLPLNSTVMVTVVANETALPHDDDDAWSTLSVEGLVRAYGDSEPEYTLDDLREK